MRRHLGLAPKAEHKSGRTMGLCVILSVRKGYQGLTQRYTYQSSTLSRLAAEIDAKKAARAEGFTPWALLDVFVPDQLERAM